MKHRIRLFVATFTTAFALTFTGQAGFLTIVDDFNAISPIESASIDGYTFFGLQRLSSGVQAGSGVGGSHAAFAVADFGATVQGFPGVGMIHDSVSLELRTDTALSLNVRSTVDFSSALGVIGFQIVDADGTAVRTQDSDLFRPTGAPTVFSQNILELNTLDAPGQDSVLDLANVVQYGILMFDRNDVDAVAEFTIDNVTVTNIVPEPGTYMMFFAVLVALLLCRRHGVQHARRDPALANAD